MNRHPVTDDCTLCPGRPKHVNAHELCEKLAARPANTVFKMEHRCFHKEALARICLNNVILNDCCFFETNLQGAELVGAKLREACLQKANLREANLSKADLRSANLRDAQLQYADLSGAQLLGADLQGADLLGTTFDHTLVTSDAFGKEIWHEADDDFKSASAIYATLRRNFEEMAEYDSASWAYYRERVCKYQTHRLGQPLESFGVSEVAGRSQLRAWFANRSWLYWLSGLFQDWLWGFAKKPQRVLIWAGFIVALFSLLYCQGRLICFGDSMCTPGAALPDLTHGVLYSLAAFSTSSAPHLIPATPGASVISSVEGILGVTMLALFTTSLASKLGGA